MDQQVCKQCAESHDEATHKTWEPVTLGGMVLAIAPLPDQVKLLWLLGFSTEQTYPTSTG